MIKSSRPLEKFQFSKIRKELKELKDSIRSFSEDYRDLISDRHDAFTSVDKISGRDEEVWAPVIIIADILATLLDSPIIKEDMVTLAKRVILQRRRTSLVGNRDLQILESTWAFVEEKKPLNGDSLYVGDELCRFIGDRWSLPGLKLEAVSRTLNRYDVIRSVKRPRLTDKEREVRVQKSCYQLDKTRLSKLVTQLLDGEEEL